MQRSPRTTTRDPRFGQRTLRTNQTSRGENALHPTQPMAGNRGQATHRSHYCQSQHNRLPTLPMAETRRFVMSTNNTSVFHHGKAVAKRHHLQSIGHSLIMVFSNSGKMAKSYRHFCRWNLTFPANYNSNWLHNSAQDSPANASAARWQPTHLISCYTPVPDLPLSPDSCRQATLSTSQSLQQRFHRPSSKDGDAGHHRN